MTDHCECRVGRCQAHQKKKHDKLLTFAFVPRRLRSNRIPELLRATPWAENQVWPQTPSLISWGLAVPILNPPEHRTPQTRPQTHLDLHRLKAERRPVCRLSGNIHDINQGADGCK